jgi:tetraacyldisaccharide 4'-kinase
VARGVEDWLQRVWYGDRRGFAWLLLPLSWVFRLGSALHRAVYRCGLARAHRAGVPVVVVGNLTVGGTGKSPLVIALAMALAGRGVAVGILMRGYGSGRRRPARVSPDDDPAEAGDEAVMAARSTGLPVVAGADRASGAALLRSLGVRLVLCDDGLQHHALGRDLEIAVVDGRRGFGNGRLLPAGPLREAPERLASVDWVVFHGTAADADRVAARDAAPRRRQGREGVVIMRLEPGSAQPLTAQVAPRPLSDFAAAPVHAVAGIGDPDRFFGMLRAAGLSPVEHAFPDHHPYAARELRFGDGLPVLMTAKDAVKCRKFADPLWWEVPVVARLSPDDGSVLIDRIAALAAAQGDA